MNATEMPGGTAAVIVMVADADLVVSETEVAVTVTVAGLGIVAGAVKLVATPLAVAVGLNVPQGEALQLTVQLIPPFLLSLLTTAVTPVLVLIASDVGGAELKDTEITAGGVGGVEPPPPHAVSQRVRVAMANRECTGRRNFTGRLHSVCPASDAEQIH